MTGNATAPTLSEQFAALEDWTFDVHRFVVNNRDAILAALRLAESASPLPSRGDARGDGADGWRSPLDEDARNSGDVLVYRQDAGMFTARYRLNADETEECWFDADGFDLTDNLPTHWRPLPAPPGARNATEERGS